MKKPSPFPATLETERFELRKLSRWAFFLITLKHWTQDSEILGNITNSSKSRSFWTWLNKAPYPKRRRPCYAIYPKGSDTAIGLHLIRLVPYKSATFVVAIHDRDWWGKGVAVEVRRVLITMLFETPMVNRIYGEVYARNFAAQFNYKSLGFTNIGTLHKTSIDSHTGLVRDRVMFEMLQENWQTEAGDDT